MTTSSGQAGDDGGHVGSEAVIVLPSRGVFAELLAVALRAADAQARPGCDTETRDDLVGVADALHRRLGQAYGHRDDRTLAPVPPLGELMRMLASALPPSAVPERDDLAGLYLFMFLIQPRVPDPHRSEAPTVGLRELTAFAAGDLDADGALQVSTVLLTDPAAQSQLRELLEVTSRLPRTTKNAAELDPRERMPDHVWERALRTIAAAQDKREQQDADPGNLP